MADHGGGSGAHFGWLLDSALGFIGQLSEHASKAMSEESFRAIAEEAGGSPECVTCPVCQAMRKVRHTDPAVVEEMSGVARNLMSGFMSAVEAAGAKSRANPTSPDSTSPDPTSPDPTSSDPTSSDSPPAAPSDARSPEAPQDPQAPSGSSDVHETPEMHDTSEHRNPPTDS